MEKQRIIPAISNHKKLKEFLVTELKYGILMGFHLAQLDSLVKEMKQAGKKVLIHSELIKGLASDEFGAIYLIQTLKVDGLISSKPKVIETCQKRGVIGIYRFFIKDSISLEQSLDIGTRLKPKYVEILPAACYGLIEKIEKTLHSKVLMGGLIEDETLAKKCFDYGAIAITTSESKLWDLE